MLLSLIDNTDVSRAFADHLRGLRKQATLSRDALAQRSCVPAATIKKFELTGQISFRQLLLLWQALDSLDRLYQLTQPTSPTSLTSPNAQDRPMPKSIDEVLKNGF